MKACTAAQMRQIDKMAEELGGIPSIVLMENAALACVEALGEVRGKRIGVFCGKGNNGGDGFAMARHLVNRGAQVTVFLVCGSEFAGDALVNFEIISKMGIPIIEIADTELLPYQIQLQDVVVDAVFGTGMHGLITGIPAEVIALLNQYATFILAVDIPSGVQADTGELCGVAVKADKTVTFAAYKTGMLLYPGAGYVGQVVVADISIPEYIINGQELPCNVLDAQLIQNWMPARKADSHKGDYGKVLIVGGSEGMTGAPTLAARAALRCGSGLVTVGIPAGLNPIMEVKLTEAMTLPLADECGALCIAAAERIVQKMNGCDVLLFGPGIGRGPAVLPILKQILANAKIPVIIDADGLNALAGNLQVLDVCSCNLIFTPHSMEFSRLSGHPPAAVEAARLAVSGEFAQEQGVTLVLKGSRTVVTAPDGEQYVNITGNSGMATGGSGDVLAGMIAAFVARGLGETESAALAVYLHGLAGDIAAGKVGKEALNAGDIVDSIPDALILPVEYTK